MHVCRDEGIVVLRYLELRLSALVDKHSSAHAADGFAGHVPLPAIALARGARKTEQEAFVRKPSGIDCIVCAAEALRTDKHISGDLEEMGRDESSTTFCRNPRSSNGTLGNGIQKRLRQIT